MIKTRFAPSPTGYLHVGGLRTALYCYLFARKNKGKFVLRIEDTDQERYVEGAVENLINTMKWIGLDYDEGPFFQSQRTAVYKEHADKLIASGHAYRCFCTKERLDEMRENQLKNKQATMYDRKCCDLPESEIKHKLENNEPFVIRQKVPYTTIKFKDLIRGNVQFNGKTIDDQVLVKTDGFPTYHLANVVDDHFMEITHVIRGEEWLPSTPKHIALYEAFGWEAPTFAHLPLLLNADRSKLSKRQGHVSVEEYIQEGYIKEAIINFAAFLGWNPGSGSEQEIFSLQELEEIFDIERVHKSGAIFNLEKLDWFNWQWRKRLYEEDTRSVTEKLLKLCEQYIDQNYLKNSELLNKALPSIAEKILKNPKEINEIIGFYFKLPDYDKSLLTHEKMQIDFNMAENSLKESLKDLQNLKEWNENTLQETLNATIQRLGLKNGQILWPIRSALSGLQFSPGVFEIAAVLGKIETLNRIEFALEKLKK